MSVLAASDKGRRFDRLMPRAIVGAGCIGAVLSGLIVYLLLVVPSAPPPIDAATGKELSNCLEHYRSDGIASDVESLNRWSGFCYEANRSQLLIDEENIRKQNFVFQRHENSVLLVIVVVITLSGVALAGLQLLASYKLAAVGKGELAGGAEITYSGDAVSFKSSVVGLVILVVSFAFFIVFIREVYTLKEVTSASPAVPGIAASSGIARRQLFSGPIIPKPTANPAEQNTPEISKPSDPVRP